MREFAKSFYLSTAWERTRNAYASSVGYLCERCRDKGLCNPGEIVHHKTHLSPDNINDASITLSFDNLMLVCRDCHADLHKKRSERYSFADDGSIAPP